MTMRWKHILFIFYCVAELQIMLYIFLEQCRCWFKLQIDLSSELEMYFFRLYKYHPHDLGLDRPNLLNSE